MIWIFLGVTEDMALNRAEWKKRIQTAADPEFWYKGFVVVFVLIIIHKIH